MESVPSSHRGLRGSKSTSVLPDPGVSSAFITALTPQFVKEAPVWSVPTPRDKTSSVRRGQTHSNLCLCMFVSDTAETEADVEQEPGGLAYRCEKHQQRERGYRVQDPQHTERRAGTGLHSHLIVKLLIDESFSRDHSCG